MRSELDLDYYDFNSWWRKYETNITIRALVRSFLDRARLILDRASSATAGCKGSEDDSKGERKREREGEGGEDRGEEAAWVEAMACGGRQKGMLLSFVSRAYFGAPSLFASSRSVP